MIPNPDDLKTLINEYRTLNIEELKTRIEQLRKGSKCPSKLKNIDIAKKELEFKYKMRQEQIEILTKSLTSSSRFGRWISSFRAVLSQLFESKN